MENTLVNKQYWVVQKIGLEFSTVLFTWRISSLTFLYLSSILTISRKEIYFPEPLSNWNTAFCFLSQAKEILTEKRLNLAGLICLFLKLLESFCVLTWQGQRQAAHESLLPTLEMKTLKSNYSSRLCGSLALRRQTLLSWTQELQPLGECDPDGNELRRK